MGSGRVQGGVLGIYVYLDVVAHSLKSIICKNFRQDEETKF